MNILLVAPAAPPKNSPEAIQVGRFLAALDQSIGVTLVTTPTVRGWQWEDSTLAVERPGMQIITVTLPLHRLAQRILANRHLKGLHVPDADFWLPLLSDQALRKIKKKPDVIYSRSVPFSSALLARRLKQRLGLPWMMHLSDPWYGNPYHQLPVGRRDTTRAMEAACVADADLISMTTEGQAAYYRERYPDRAPDIIVTPNMMPMPIGPVISIPKLNRGTFRLVYTGALYGNREPSTLLAALRLLHAQAPSEATKLEVEFYGNMMPEIAAAIDATPGCRQHGAVSFDAAAAAQDGADALLTIEPDGSDALLRHFMPSKNLDYIARRKPILAITPAGSETERLCSAGYGWPIMPGDASGLAERLALLTRSHIAGDKPFVPPDPQHSLYRAERVAKLVLDTLRGMRSRNSFRESAI